MGVEYLHLRPGASPPELACLPRRVIVVAETKVEPSWLHAIAEWIVKIGALYVVAWGVDCELWHDSVDWAVLETFDFADIPDDRFVMTTWHANDPLTEALWFAGVCAVHPDVTLEDTILLHIADAARRHDLLGQYAASQTSLD